MNRRKFFAQMRKLGFSKSRFQMTRIGLTYEKDADGNRISVTVPKHHESTFTILGDVPYSGIFVDSAGNFIEVTDECTQVFHKPSTENEWSCADCGSTGVSRNRFRE